MLVTSWGGPRLTADLLDAAPMLALVLYGAGSVRPVVTPESFARGVRITSAASANALPVAEFALAQILYALKHGWRYVLASRSAGATAPRAAEPGANGSVVGLVALGATGTRDRAAAGPPRRGGAGERPVRRPGRRRPGSAPASASTSCSPPPTS